MKQKNFNRFLVIFILAAITLSVSACSKGGAGSDSSAAGSSVAPKNGGSVIVGVTNEPDNLDPYLAQAAGTREILFNIFEGLVKPDSNGNLQPAVAQSYDISKDSLKYTFTLRSGIKFQNGNAVTAEDVKYSLDKASGKGTDVKVSVISGLENIKSVDILDASHVAVTLSKPDPDFLPYLTVAIVPKDYDQQSTKPVGTGPFAFSSYSPQQSIVLTKNPNYWQHGRPYLDKVTFKIEPDADTAFLELKSGSIDLFPYLPVDKADQLGADYTPQQGNANVVQMLVLNNAVKPLDNLKVRQALSYAVSRDEIIKAIGYGYGTKVGSAVIPGLKTYFNSSLSNSYKTETAKAKSLLSEAGYKNGFDLEITVPSNYITHVDTAQVIISELKKVGVNAKIKQVDWNTWLTQVYQNKQYQATVIGIDGANLSPRSFLGRYVTKADGNFLNYSNSSYDTLYQKALAESDSSKRVEDYKQLQKILSDDAASVYIQDPAVMIAVKNGIAGYHFYPLYVQDMSSVYYTK